MLIELTFLTRDENNGKTFLVKHDTIQSVAPAEMRSDDVVLIGVTKMIEGSFVWFTGGHKQLVSETMMEIKERVNEVEARGCCK